MTSPFFMFLKIVGVIMAGSAIFGTLDHFARKKAKQTLDLSGEKPRPSLVYKSIQVVLAATMVAAPFYIMYSTVQSERAKSKFPPQPAFCRFKLGPYEKKWQC